MDERGEQRSGGLLPRQRRSGGLQPHGAARLRCRDPRAEGRATVRLDAGPQQGRDRRDVLPLPGPRCVADLRLDFDEQRRELRRAAGDDRLHRGRPDLPRHLARRPRHLRRHRPAPRRHGRPDARDRGVHHRARRLHHRSRRGARAGLQHPDRRGERLPHDQVRRLHRRGSGPGDQRSRELAARPSAGRPRIRHRGHGAQRRAQRRLSHLWLPCPGSLARRASAVRAGDEHVRRAALPRGRRSDRPPDARPAPELPGSRRAHPPRVAGAVRRQPAALPGERSRCRHVHGSREPRGPRALHRPAGRGRRRWQGLRPVGRRPRRGPRRRTRPAA